MSQKNNNLQFLCPDVGKEHQKQKKERKGSAKRSDNTTKQQRQNKNFYLDLMNDDHCSESPINSTENERNDEVSEQSQLQFLLEEKNELSMK